MIGEYSNALFHQPGMREAKGRRKTWSESLSHGGQACNVLLVKLSVFLHQYRCIILSLVYAFIDMHLVYRSRIKSNNFGTLPRRSMADGPFYQHVNSFETPSRYDTVRMPEPLDPKRPHRGVSELMHRGEDG
jgi:hypothetical protein